MIIILLTNLFSFPAIISLDPHAILEANANTIKNTILD
jgi:hypothetical protein